MMRHRFRSAWCLQARCRPTQRRGRHPSTARRRVHIAQHWGLPFLSTRCRSSSRSAFPLVLSTRARLDEIAGVQLRILQCELDRPPLASSAAASNLTSATMLPTCASVSVGAPAHAIALHHAHLVHPPSRAESAAAHCPPAHPFPFFRTHTPKPASLPNAGKEGSKAVLPLTKQVRREPKTAAPIHFKSFFIVGQDSSF